MFAAGARALRARPRLVFGLFLVELLFALAFMLAVQRALSAVFGHHPAFARGVHGDDRVLIAVLEQAAHLLPGLAAAMLAVLIVYAGVSMYTTAGLLGALFGMPFGQAASKHALAFVRVWLISVIPFGVGLLLVVLPAAISAGDPERVAMFTPFFWRLLLGALPGILWLALLFCAIDYARVDLVTRGHTKAFLAFLRGLGQAVRPAAFAHYLIYLLFWLAIAVAYVGATLGHPFAGAAGAVELFLVRQVVAAMHLAARVVTYGGQIERSTRS
jgi:hypothetical protein